MDKKLYYKVFTKELRSLGLRKNPNILTFTPNEWYFLDNDNIREGKQDYGGIWACNGLGGANKITKYMLENFNIETRTFIVDIDRILFSNSYRVKTNGIYLDREIDLFTKVKKKILH